MKKYVFAVFAALLLAPFNAQAATISAAGYYTATTDLSSAPASNVNLEARGLSPDIFYNSYTGLPGENLQTFDVFMGGIVEGNGTNWMGSYAMPGGLGETENYIAMMSGGQTTFTLDPGVNQFSFLWGSINPGSLTDIGNNVVVTNANDDQYIITGKDLLLSLGYSPDQMAGLDGELSASITIKDLAGIKSIVLAAPAMVFEAARFAVSAVPLPGALVLFGTALGGLILRRRGIAIEA